MWLSGQTTEMKKVELDRNRIHKTRNRDDINWPVKIDHGCINTLMYFGLND